MEMGDGNIHAFVVASTDLRLTSFIYYITFVVLYQLCYICYVTFVVLTLSLLSYYIRCIKRLEELCFAAEAKNYKRYDFESCFKHYTQDRF